MPASVALGFGGKMPSLTGRMRKSLLGDLCRHRDLYCIRFSKEHSLAGRNDSVEKKEKARLLHPSHAHIDSLHPAGTYYAVLMDGIMKCHTLTAVCFVWP